jgi:hypothetical protein
MHVGVGVGVGPQRNRGLVFSRPGNVPASTTFPHPADCRIEYIVTTLPSGGSILVRFRAQDSSNAWSIRTNASGSLILDEIVDGSAQPPRASMASGLAAGHKVEIVVNGITIQGYSNGVLRWTYSSATNFQTQTSGIVASLGTGGAIADLKVRPL